ncbi:acyl-CoA thioesterase [Bdellovibrio sp. qaytius]|nr:acyl-CoA thioesterase [Bdellovibrio sp. qaytius]
MYFFETMVQETHLDIFGHMNNARYLEVFEQARWDLITQRGFSLKKIQEVGQGPVILEAHLRFLKELKQRDKIKISVECTEYNGKIGKLKQEMLNEKGEVCAELIVVIAFFDLKTRKIILPTPEWKTAIGIS